MVMSKAMDQKEVPKYVQNIIISYLSNRNVSAGNKSRKLTRGCPQGGVLSAQLWNLTYDTVLEYLENNNVIAFAFADDTLLLVPEKYKDQLEERVSSIIGGIKTIFKYLGLELNPKKTEVICIQKYPKWLREYDDWYIDTILIDGILIEINPKFKYLGVIIDYNMKFIDHVKYINEKASKIITRLYFVFRNKYGYGNRARKIMVKGCIHALYLYAACVYYKALVLKAVVKSIEEVERNINIRVARAYKNVPYLPSTVLANNPPLKYQIERSGIIGKMRTRKYGEWVNLDPPKSVLKNRKEMIIHLDHNVQEKWQHDWNQYSGNDWMKYLIPEVPVMADDEIAPQNFYLAQAITEYGCFRKFLKRINRENTDECECGIVESAEHVFMHCPKWSDGRPTKLNISELSTR